MEYQVGDKLDNQYVIVEKHHGGMSTVYVVQDEFSNKRFAVKTVRESLLDDAQAVQRFAEEGRTWMKLGRHEHIVEAIIYREIERQPFLFLSTRQEKRLMRSAGQAAFQGFSLVPPDIFG